MTEVQSVAPLRRVERVQFGILGPEEIKGEMSLSRAENVPWLTNVEHCSYVGGRDYNT